MLGKLLSVVVLMFLFVDFTLLEFDKSLLLLQFLKVDLMS